MMNANPSVDPANQDSLIGAFREIFKKLMQGMDNALPAKVIGFDRSTSKVSVQPQVMMVDTNKKTMSRAQIQNVPVLQIGGGGHFLSFNLKPGDLGWLIANDRDISGFVKSGKESAPGTYRIHNFSDSVFIPDIMRDFTINEEDEENCVLQSLDGSVRIALWPDKVKITATKLEVHGDIEASGNLKISGTVQVDGISTLNADLKVIGNITATGNITPNVPP